MSQSIPTGYLPPPPGNPIEIFLSELILATQAIALSNSLPRATNDGRIPGDGAKFSQTQRNSPLSLQKKSIRNSANYETVQIFCLENLEKPFIFYTEAKPLESL